MEIMKKASQLYSKHPLLTGALTGGLLGFFVLSPIAMILEHTTHTSTATLAEHLRELFLMGNLAWSMLFTAIGISIGLMYGYLAMRIDHLRRNLNQAEKLATLGQLAAGVAHEINTPLSNISINTESAKMKNKDAALGGNLEEISHQVDIASKIVKDLLEYSSPSDIETVEVDINDLLHRTVSFVKGMRREDLRIIESYKEDLPDIMGEHNQLQHLFMNVLNNAYDAMPDGGELEISTDETARGGVKISFKDNGCGIPPEDLSKVFDPFFTTKDPGKGTGLGLSICNSIARRHNGRVEATSEVGVGTTFTVFLRR